MEWRHFRIWQFQKASVSHPRGLQTSPMTTARTGLSSIRMFSSIIITLCWLLTFPETANVPLRSPLIFGKEQRTQGRTAQYLHSLFDGIPRVHHSPASKALREHKKEIAANSSPISERMTATLTPRISCTIGAKRILNVCARQAWSGVPSETRADGHGMSL